MAALSPIIIILLVVSVVAQVVGLYLMPLTKGLTEPLMTVLFALSFLLGVGLMARIVGMGVSMSLLLPAVAAVVPLAAIGIGVFANGEVHSFTKIGVLVAACVLVGVSNLL